jgi:YbbR domain-containing protein
MVDRILADWPFKLLSLGLAFGIWVAITGEQTIPVNFDIALDPQLPANHILAETPPNQVTVRLVGPESVIRKLNPLTMTVRLDLTKLPPGEREMQLTEAQLTGKPARAQVEFFDPERIRLVIDDRISRQLRVSPRFSGELPEGFWMYRSQVLPETVVVEGPAAVVNAMTHVETEPISLELITRRFTKQVTAVPDRPHVRIVDPQPLSVRGDVDVLPVEKSFGELTVQPSSRAFEAQIRPSVASVTLAAPPALLERLTPAQIRVTADLADLSPASGPRRVPLQVTLDVPPDQGARFIVKLIQPHQVTVRLSARSDSE